MRPDPEIIRCVRARDVWACVRCGSRTDLSTHHRIPRGMGGTRNPSLNNPANLLTLCGSGTTGCHGWVEAHPAEAFEFGYRVHRRHDPSIVPVLRFGEGWATHDAQGGVHHLDYYEPKEAS